MTPKEIEDLTRWQTYLRTGKSIDHDAISVWLLNLADGKISPKLK